MNANNHLSKYVRIGRVRQDGLFEIKFSLDTPVLPSPWSQHHMDSRGYACSMQTICWGRSTDLILSRSAFCTAKLAQWRFRSSRSSKRKCSPLTINNAGGVLGKRIVPVLRDGASTAENFAVAAEDLASSEDIATIFGVWTSAARKAVKPIVEKHKAPLVSPSV